MNFYYRMHNLSWQSNNQSNFGTVQVPKRKTIVNYVVTKTLIPGVIIFKCKDGFVSNTQLHAESQIELYALLQLLKEWTSLVVWRLVSWLDGVLCPCKTFLASWETYTKGTDMCSCLYDMYYTELNVILRWIILEIWVSINELINQFKVNQWVRGVLV